MHTVQGRRQEPSPLVLGHEILGEIVELGPGLCSDGNGRALAVGDRVSWTITASCGRCWFCSHDLPQKCDHLHKYGHVSCSEPPYLTGGFAEMIQLFPGTTLFKVPDCLADSVVTPANCALATTINAIETSGCLAGRSLLIQGAGMLGLNLIALGREYGASRVIVTDVLPSRLELARRFGADLCLDPVQLGAAALRGQIQDATAGRGVDIAFEVCGSPAAIPQALEALRIDGVYLLAGLVSPGSTFEIDGNTITRRCLTLRGIHNYRPRHLGQALAFLETCAESYPFAELAPRVYPLDQINEAFAEAATGSAIRIGVTT